MTYTLTDKEGFVKLLDKLSSQEFLAMKGLNQEVPLFIYHFDPSEKLYFEEDFLPKLKQQLDEKNVTVLEINLYDLAIEILKERGEFEEMCAIEAETEKSIFLEAMQSLLSVENHIIPSIAKKVMEYQASKKIDILFITGVGEVYPYIRTHVLLNNVQSLVKEFPLLLFFPGVYDSSNENGSSLHLFMAETGDNYYRAFDITQYHA